MKKHFLTVVYAIDDKPETVEAILAQRPWQAVAHTDALKDLEHAQADMTATIDGYDAARLEIATNKKRAAIAAKTLETYKQSGMDFAARVQALERTADKLREENAALQQRDDDWNKEHSNALVEIASLKVRAADARHDIDDLTARDESQRLRIAELEAQLEAIGAGGVEPLRKRECLHKIEEPAPSEWDVRGHLAESLTCWCRLTGQEAAELVALFQGRPEQADAQRDAQRYRWLRDMNDWHSDPRIEDADGTKWQLTFYTSQIIEDQSDDDNLDSAIDAARADA